MRKRRKTLLFVLCLAGRQPTYQGHTLEYWLRIYDAGYTHIREAMPEQARQAEEAVRHIGTRALPFALKWIQYESPGWQFQLAGVMWKLRMSASVKERLRSAIFNDRKRKRVGLGFRSFQILGEKAAPAIPDLVRLLYSPNRKKSARAAMALRAIGSSSIPSLLDAFSDTNFPHRVVYLDSVDDELPADLGTNVPVLIRVIQEAKPAAVAIAAYTLIKLRIEPEAVVPALTNAFAAKDAEVRFRVVGIFKVFGAYGMSNYVNQAAPALRGMLNDPDDRVREDASEILARIASQATTDAQAQ